MSNNNLIIGLGGSGGKVIREIRKIFVSNGALNYEQNDARFEFLYVDTSTDELDKESLWSVLGRDIQLERSQIIINKAGAVRPVLEDPASYPGLKGWIKPTSVFDFVSPTTAGAAQKRKLGRLVFAQNVATFVKALDVRMQALTSAGKVGVTTHIICGLAGGTGSGTIIDAIAQIRNRYPDPEQYKILVYALIPEKYPKEGRIKNVSGFANYFANAYAALRELNALGVGKYHPVNVLDGSRMNHATYFNGCYLLNDVNEHKVQFDIEQDVPKVLAEFIYQKSISTGWDGLSRAEKGENDTRNFECEGEEKARAKLFLSFGIKRVIVPEEEIKEYMAYSFAEQVIRQLMFNNFREGEGYVDEEVRKDWGSEARKADVLQTYRLTNQHLCLEVGILEDDQKITTWKSLKEFWTHAVSMQAVNIPKDKSLDRTQWLPEIANRLARIFDETYRTVGVRKFYEIKSKARMEMAAHIARVVEVDLFSRWQAGDFSLSQARSFLDAILLELQERQASLNEKTQRDAESLKDIHAKIEEQSRQFNDVGWLSQKVTDKSESVFAKIAELQQLLYFTRSAIEGQRFAATLFPVVREKLTDLRAAVDELQQHLGEATERFTTEINLRLDNQDDVVYQKRVFDAAAIKRITKAIKVDESGQKDRSQRVRKALIAIGGADTNSFDKLNKALGVGSILSLLSRESAEIVEMAHLEIAKTEEPVLKVNIVGRLMKQFDANPKGLKEFVQSLYDDAGCMVILDQPEVDRVVQNNAAGFQGRAQTLGVFLPECPEYSDFREELKATFARQQDVGTDAKIMVGTLSNQITIMKVSSLMPARFISDLREFKRHYDGISADRNEAILLHSEGDGAALPDLYAKTQKQIESESKQQPMILIAKLLGLIKQRANVSTGLNEWVIAYKSGGLPTSKPLEIDGEGNFAGLLNTKQKSDIQEIINKEVSRTLESGYTHIAKKKELMASYFEYAMDVYSRNGENDLAPEYVLVSGMRSPICGIVGIPESQLD